MTYEWNVQTLVAMVSMVAMVTQRWPRNVANLAFSSPGNHEIEGNHYRIKENVVGYVTFNQHTLNCRKNVGGHL